MLNALTRGGGAVGATVGVIDVGGNCVGAALAGAGACVGAFVTRVIMRPISVPTPTPLELHSMIETVVTLTSSHVKLHAKLLALHLTADAAEPMPLREPTARHSAVVIVDVPAFQQM